ncbi:MAG: adenylate/guanylate cyclase domain-containing protein [Syntrophobacteraceae bacterium]
MAKLIIKESNGIREVTLQKLNSVGRSPDNQVQLSDPLVSKQHCLIFADQNDNYSIKDLGSRNGTFVNKKRIQGDVSLQNGDEISLGTTSCMFQLGMASSLVALDDERCQIIVFDQIYLKSLQRSRFLPEKEISDEKALRTDYEKLRIAHELQHDIGLELNLTRIFNRILARTFDVLVCDQAVILMADAKGDMTVEAFKTRTPKDGVVVSSTLIRRVQENKVGIISADALADERFQDAVSIVSQKVRSSMAVPILYEEELLGIMIIESSAAIMQYTRKDLLLFNNIALQTANLIKMAEMAKKIETDAATRERFQRLLSPDLAEMVVSGKLKVEKGGEERIATTLFADIRGFTSMCEKMEASEVLILLNEFFEMMVEIAFSYEGTVDKFVGDMIMVVWGAPVAHSDDPRRAVQAALDMQAALDRYNAARKQPIRIGIGINTDRLVAGYIGSTRTMSYSVIGDAVNIASRLCSAAGPGQVLISENTYRKVRKHFDAIELDPVKAKGKSTPLKVFGVRGPKLGPDTVID